VFGQEDPTIIQQIRKSHNQGAGVSKHPLLRLNYFPNPVLPPTQGDPAKEADTQKLHDQSVVMGIKVRLAETIPNFWSLPQAEQDVHIKRVRQMEDTSNCIPNS
jgi:hypothetical protein